MSVDIEHENGTVYEFHVHVCDIVFKKSIDMLSVSIPVHIIPGPQSSSQSHQLKDWSVADIRLVLSCA